MASMDLDQERRPQIPGVFVTELGTNHGIPMGITFIGMKWLKRWILYVLFKKYQNQVYIGYIDISYQYVRCYQYVFIHV